MDQKGFSNKFRKSKVNNKINKLEKVKENDEIIVFIVLAFATREVSPIQNPILDTFIIILHNYTFKSVSSDSYYNT